MSFIGYGLTFLFIALAVWIAFAIDKKYPAKENNQEYY